MPTITIPDSEVLQLGRIGAMTVDWSKIPQHVLDHIWKVHSSQFFTDAANAGGKDVPAAERLALAQKKRDACYAGDLRVRSSGPADPFEFECWSIAKADLTSAMRKAGIWKDIPKGTKDAATFVLNRELAKAGHSPTTMDAATASHLKKNRDAIEKRAHAAIAARGKTDIATLLGL